MTVQCASHLVLSSSAAVVLTVVLAVPVSAQSLADVARQTGAERNAAPAGKVYTNDSLPATQPPPVQPATPAGQDTKTGGQDTKVGDSPAAEAAPEKTAEADEKKDEPYWRGRIQAERDGLARAESFAEALQSRINGLSTDFVNRDDPAQRNVIAADRQKALDELARVQREIAAHKKAIDDIQQEARRAGAPAGWLR